MNIDRYIELWNQAAVQVVDVQHHMLGHGEDSMIHELPTSGLIYTVRGGGLIYMDYNQYRTDRYHLIHGGKGSFLQIDVLEEQLEYYLILYQAHILLSAGTAARLLPDGSQLLEIQYDLKPIHPVMLQDKISQLRQMWTSPHRLQEMQVRSIFLQVMMEILEQLQSSEVSSEPPDLVAQAMSYIQEHYHLPITIDSLAAKLECSPRHLGRLFRNSEIGQSPSDYLVQFRMSKARELLVQTDLALKDVASSIGYEDVYHFSRMFKKYCGLSPIHYRNQYLQSPTGLNTTSAMSDISIVESLIPRYIDNGSQNKQVSGGSFMMYNWSRRSTVMMLLLSFSLLMSACASPAPSTNAPAVSSGSEQATADTTSSRTINHDLGSTKVPVEPTRIVVLEQGFTQTLAALEVKPVGVADDNKPERFPKDTLAYIEGYTSVGTRSEPNLEVIRTLKPDLIIADTSRHGNVYDELSAIAPTIVFKNDTANYEDILVSTEKIGEALGKTEATTALLEEHQKRLDELKQMINPQQSVLIVAADEDETQSFQVRTDQAFHSSFLSAAGLNYALKDEKEVNQLMTTEQLLTIDSDQILILINEDGPSVLEGQKDNLLWNQLKAVQNGNAHEVELATWSRQRSIPALNNIMDEAAAYFK
ncbi:hypothetical protein BK131_13280 [Paenibacillus amylolyticus]|uniref:AraC family transcriptional regulator n=1 Tax=Paenibacillus amylolyticus TaxID=1451 RepID=A0A1R1BXB7_PAEAM|nr:ABC transporter substrate-binding protein [Paenibacillus amylolyticus]OMF14428.1 hypothetical protein BK131_13280 [Paenibacillus amylolyticus]